MHLLAAQPGAISDGSAAVDLGQTPGDMIVLSAADSEIACLAAAQRQLAADEANWPSLRLASLLQLGHNYSVDLYIDKVLTPARLIVVRLLGGRGYWAYGVERLAALARERGALLALLPGDDQPDAELAALSTVPAEALHRLWRYLAEGGAANAREFLRYAASLIGRNTSWREPAPLLHAGLYWPGHDTIDLDAIRNHWQADAPVAAVVFYRALVPAANTVPVDALIAALQARGLNPLPLFATSLKDPQSAAILGAALSEAPPDIVLNATGFAVSAPGEAHRAGVFGAADCPVLQVIFAGGDEASWRQGMRGLDARDIAMNVALPEIDGRIIARALSFKAAPQRDPLTEADITRYAPVADRIAFTADLACNWVRLRRTPPEERRVVLVLANYPHRDGRIGNGVGLDTPQATIEALRALAAAGYRVEDIPEDGDALIRRLLAGPTNAAAGHNRPAEETFARSDYAAVFASLPRAAQDKVSVRWGPPERDPFFRESRLDCGSFAIPAIRCGNIAVAVQPSRGYNIDPTQSYHDPDLVPPHGYLAFYGWINDGLRAQAVVHMGKHGNLEWLPGKALALSAECFPEAALGPLPHLYPFIVNDPGEGTQAKRRAQAVIIDHLTPPLTRAESYGRLAELERLVDEYYAAAGSDPRRLALLRGQILDLARATGLDRDCGIAAGESDDAALGKLDAYLCELKEMQIRDGLHIFGRAPEGEQLTDLLVALTRLPRGAAPEQASLIRALADDLDLGFDPLAADLGTPWTGPRPAALLDARRSHSTPSPLGERVGVRGRGLGDAETYVTGTGRKEVPPHPTHDPFDRAAIEPAWGRPQGGRPGRAPEGRGGGATDAGATPAEQIAWRSAGDTVERLEELARDLVAGKRAPEPGWTRTRAVLDGIERGLRPAVIACGKAETEGLLRGLAGQFVPPGPSGAPTRGRPEVLPTGRNFYSLDTRAVPTPAAWHLGWKSAQLLVARHAQEHGSYPRRLALSAWGTSNMRTGGDDIAQALALMGVRPQWEPKSGRVTGFEIMPASLLDRPRVDVTLRVSGFFRDAFPNLIDLVDSAARAVAALDEPAEINPLAARVASDRAALAAKGVPAEEAARRAGHRVFGSKPGAYGAGLQALIDERGWHDERDLAEAYLAWGGYAYGAGAQGAAEPALFRERLTGVEAVVQNQDNREHDLLDSDDYYQFEGGLAVAVRHLAGSAPVVYHNDHSRPENPRIRTLDEEVGRVVHARVVNPKWLAGVMRHGYKGGFEMAATVDYLFAFAATARAVKDHHFDAVYDAYLDDANVRDFLAAHNPDALGEIAQRLGEAIDRGLWRPRRNSLRERLDEIARRRR